MTVDQKVWDLAEMFIADVSPEPEPGPGMLHATQALAETIQRTIEDWIENEQLPGGMLS